MAGGLIMAGVGLLIAEGAGSQAVKSSNELKQQIPAQAKKTADLKNKWAIMMTQRKHVNAQAGADIIASLDDIFKLNAAMKLTKEKHAEQKLAIENVGIAIIALLVCMLGFKHFGLFDDVEDMFFGRTFEVPLAVKVTPARAAQIGYQI